MKSEITREFIDQLIILLHEKSTRKILEMIKEFHPADIAEIMEVLNLEEAKSLYMLLDEEKASDVLVEIPEDDRKRFLNALPPEVIASRFIEHMDSDDAADVIADMEEELQKAVLQGIKDKEQASDIADLLVYDEHTAGGIMAKELVAVNENWTVQTCLKEISKQAEDIDEIYYVYVVDDDYNLQGILSLKKLILQPTQKKIKNLVTEEIYFVNVNANQQEVAHVMSKYDLVALPVVDQLGRLKGRITIDDVLDVIKEEAEKDYQMVSGISGDVEAGDRVWQLTRARIPWLFIGLLGGITGALVLGSHEESLKKIPEVAFFIPLIAAMAGNVGVQSSSIVVQSIASGSRDFDSFGRKLLKELSVALITALLFSTLIFSYNFFMHESMNLTFSVSLSLFVVIIFASTFGTIIPLILNRFKIDPAVATGPFITTMNDILGLIVYMLIANSFYNLI